MDKKVYAVDGMSCQGCSAGVAKAIQHAIPGAEVSVDLTGKRVTVSPGLDAQVQAAVEAAGFDFRGVVG